tara:strand:- start:69 stop:203 length:135 start_codon:yes stop_codon:yes gene_type:complete
MEMMAAEEVKVTHKEITQAEAAVVPEAQAVILRKMAQVTEVMVV